MGDLNLICVNLVLLFGDLSLSFDASMLVFDALILLFAMSSSISLSHDVAFARKQVWLI